MKITENALNVLAAKSFPGIGKAWVFKNLKGNEPIERVVALLRNSGKGAESVTCEQFEKIREEFRILVQRLSNVADGAIGIGDFDFPLPRGEVKNSEQPVLLFYRGDIRLLRRDNKNIAVIGLLNPDNDTEIQERYFVERLVGYGATIVSGLAVGCDAIAHGVAVRTGGKTVAVLPSALDDVLPTANRGLAKEIVKSGGLLLTEYWSKASSKMELNGRYQERDRLQALFSDCIVLTASYAKNDLGNDSGSRLAMEYARNYRIRRSVMYDQATHFGNPKYDLNRQIIAAMDGATVIDSTNLDLAARKIVEFREGARQEVIFQTDLFG